MNRTLKRPMFRIGGSAGTGIMGGMRGSGTSTQNIPNPTPLQTALGLGTTLAGIYGAFKNPGSTDFGRFIK